ncbi:MutS-related protein [Methylobacter tundripaludum]|uniref:MutS-related protein n=1 Tax=Methylobacter tundripaludum TaxID=173365 RepID=UPI0004DEF7E8|nr:DNA mismatch repair protein MutS [Methylobacter tundripaludum]
MKAHLMYLDRDFNLQRVLPSNEQALMQDLELDILFNSMACGDEFLYRVAKHAVLSGLQDDLETILYRQDVLKDCLMNHAVAKSIYDIAVESIESKKGSWFGIFSHCPTSILYDAINLLQMLIGMLKKLKLIADEHSDGFESKGFSTFFMMLKTELTDEYFASIEHHLTELKFEEGVLVSAELGIGNEGANYVLRKSLTKKPGWIQRMFEQGPPAYTFHIHERDEAGAQALSELRDRGINQVANRLAQSTDHIMSFFVMLRTELAFHIGCVNLHDRLFQKGERASFPVPAPPGAHYHSCLGLYDVCLALSIEQPVVVNSLAADGKNLVIITGANQGGKSSFLRSIGLAQLMMQCGMFVAAESFSANICQGIFTHYKREEDTAMQSGKLDEELCRMNDIIDTLIPNSMLLFNESFAATNEREGSEIARQIVRFLLETPVKVFFVTHLYEFAHGLFEQKIENALFLRAERQADGRRTFKLLEGEPLQTSYGLDLYQEIFGK